MKTLADCLPDLANDCSFEREKSRKYLGVKVLCEHKVGGWPGKHKNVFYWVELENGKKVGWNENPAKGWSFPVI